MVSVNINYLNTRKTGETLAKSLPEFCKKVTEIFKWDDTGVKDEEICIFYFDENNKLVKVRDEQEYSTMFSLLKNNSDIYVNLIKNIPKNIGQFPISGFDSFVENVVGQNITLAKENILRQLFDFPRQEVNYVENQEETGEICERCEEIIKGNLYKRILPDVNDDDKYICEKCAKSGKEVVIKL